MPDIEITDVPEETLAVFQCRAAAANQTLEDYMLAWLTEEAARLVTAEHLQRLGLLAADLESPEVMARAWDLPSDQSRRTENETWPPPTFPLLKAMSCGGRYWD